MLELNNVAVLRDKRTIFSGISGSIRRGELVALVGENGAGKSTLLHAIAGCLPYQGQITLDGKELKHYDEATLATKRAVLSQHHNTSFAFGVPEIVAMGRHMMTETQSHCYQRVNSYIRLLNLEHLVERSSQQLSGGELQRVYFAKCLAQLDAFSESSSQSLMLLDEPTSALDLKHQHKLLQLVQRYTTQGGSAIVAIHDLNLAALYVDKVMLIHQGKLQAFGTPSQVFTTETLEAVYQTPMHVSKHPTKHYPMIFSEPEEFINENASFS